jgi:hypothetical protein
MADGLFIKDAFSFQRVTKHGAEEVILTRNSDLSEIIEEDKKRTSIVQTIIAFLIQSGFDSQGLLTEIDNYMDKAKMHPDNDDFANQSKIEEILNNKEKVDAFIDNISLNLGDGDEEMNKDFFSELYRRWLIVEYIEDEESSD